MMEDHSTAAVYRPLLLDERNPEDAAALAELRVSKTVEMVDKRNLLYAEFATLVNPPELSEGPESERWVHYPWRRAAVALPGPQLLRGLRLDRNRNIITVAEQAALSTQLIGVVGQSVGHTVAHTLALEGICGGLRLADFDEMELTNLNRVPVTLFDLGINKSVVAARRIAELDPYLPVEVYDRGLHDGNIDAFLAGLSIVVEECDSLDVKLAVREAAQRHRVPLIMQSNDRGLLDVERFDLEPDRTPFHGLIGDTRAAALRGLSTRDKAPHVIRILDGRNLSDKLAASMVEIGETMNSWPQLAGDVQLGGATVAAAVRRIGLGQKLPSGRTRIDVEQCLDSIVEPPPIAETPQADQPADDVAPRPGIETVLYAAQRAPSGGNVQPWRLATGPGELSISLVPERTSSMDIGYRGSALAVGAALYNARVAAAAQGLLGASRLCSDGSAELTAVLELGTATDPQLARDYAGVLARHTNRRDGTGAAVPSAVLDAIGAAAALGGGGLRWVTARSAIEEAAELLAESDRVRYLTPRLHEEMFAELRWPGEDVRSGTDVSTLELPPDEMVKLEVAGRADVMAQLRAWSGGAALGDATRDRMRTGSAVAVLTYPAPPEANDLLTYARAGEALQRAWIEAERHGLAVQPVSPVFLFARRSGELSAVSPGFADTLASLQGRFLDLLGVPPDELMVLVLRLSYATDVTVRSRRLPVPQAGLFG